MAYTPITDPAYTIRVHVGLDRVSWFVGITDNTVEGKPVYYGAGKCVYRAINRAFDKLHDEPCDL